MFVGRIVLAVLVILLGAFVRAEEYTDSMLPSCFEMNKVYIGYPMNNSETGDRYLDNCPDPKHCQKLCQEEVECKWFNWSNSGNVTRCWIKRGKGKAKEEPGGITGPKYCKPERNCIENDRIYIGDGFNYWENNKNNFGSQKSAAACQDLCARTEHCGWFNWNKDSQCYLKKSHGQWIEPNVRLEPGVRTGPRECPYMLDEEGCLEGWHYFNGKCYMVNLKKEYIIISFPGAKQRCEDYGASLVSLESEEEFTFVKDILIRNLFQLEGIDFWVDAKRAVNDTEYKWQMNETIVDVSQISMSEGEAGDECLQLVRDNSPSWKYVINNCEEEDEDVSFICEKSALPPIKSYRITGCDTSDSQDDLHGCDNTFDGDLDPTRNWAWTGDLDASILLYLDSPADINTIIFLTGPRWKDKKITDFKIEVQAEFSSFEPVSVTRVNKDNATFQGSRVYLSGEVDGVRVSFNEMENITAVKIVVSGSVAGHGGDLTEVFILNIQNTNMDWSEDVHDIINKIPCDPDAKSVVSGDTKNIVYWPVKAIFKNAVQEKGLSYPKNDRNSEFWIPYSRPANFWLAPNDKTNTSFTLRLMCPQTFDGIQLVNTHNGEHKNRATKEFRVHVSLTESGPWTNILHETLEDTRYQPDPLPIQKFHLDKEVIAQYIRFELVSWWGYGGGLQFFDIIRT